MPKTQPYVEANVEKSRHPQRGICLCPPSESDLDEVAIEFIRLNQDHHVSDNETHRHDNHRSEGDDVTSILWTRWGKQISHGFGQTRLGKDEVKKQENELISDSMTHANS